MDCSQRHGHVYRRGVSKIIKGWAIYIKKKHPKTPPMNVIRRFKLLKIYYFTCGMPSKIRYPITIHYNNDSFGPGWAYCSHKEFKECFKVIKYV